MSENTVLVTGFGPFGEHQINASWEAVRLLPNYKLDGVNIVIEEIPVIYKHVNEAIPLLWEKLNPKLVIHVGVSSMAVKLTIETEANRTGYERIDCLGKVPSTGEVCCSVDGTDCIKSKLDVDKICEFVNQNTNISACKSFHAGRYLCEFTYYKSLNIDPNRTLFVHVPPLDKPYSVEQLAEGIISVIKCALSQINAD